MNAAPGPPRPHETPMSQPNPPENDDNERELLESSIPLTSAGRRFDQVLAELFPDFSRSRLTEWIKSGDALLDGRLVKPKEAVRGGEPVTLSVRIEVETGSLDALLLVLLAWAIAIVQGIMVAGSSRSSFGSLAASGFVTTLLLYVGINIGMVIGLLPVVGIPLPLISYGGTAIVTVMIGFGLLMAVHLNRTNDMTLRGLF